MTCVRVTSCLVFVHLNHRLQQRVVEAGTVIACIVLGLLTAPAQAGRQSTGRVRRSTPLIRWLWLELGSGDLPGHIHEHGLPEDGGPGVQR